jgi:hypothetical protein
MTFGKLSAILTEEQEKNLNRLDWFLTVADNEIDKVKSFFERLEVLEPNNKEIHKKNKELILFKINQIYHLILSLEENIYTSSFDYYKQHFGLHKNKNNFLEMKEMTISYEFESFLAQLKSLIDIFLKYMWEVKLENKLLSELSKIKNVRKNMDSFEFISKDMDILSQKNSSTEDYKNSNIKVNLLKKEKSLSFFFKNYTAFYNLKNYRDFIVHRGRIKQDKSVSQADRYVQYEYHIPELQLTNKEYIIDDKHLFRLDFYCRLRYIELIYTIWKSLSEIIEPEQIIDAQNEVKNMDSNDIKVVLKYLGRKLIWNDKSFMTKQDIDDFLKTVNLNFNDLVVDKETAERKMKDTKSAKGEDMSYLLERTIYKSIRGFRFQRIRYNYDRDWKPEREKDTYGFTRTSFTVEDIPISKEKVEKILNLFIKLGLIIKINEMGSTRYEFIDEELKHYIATLIDLSQYKWSFIQYPQIEFFRKPNSEETQLLKGIHKEKMDDYLNKEFEKKKNQAKTYKMDKLKKIEWKKFKDKNNLNIKNFKKNSLNYKEISQTWDSGLYKEIQDNWSKQYSEEGHFDILNKEGTQVIDRVFLLEYLHELNTDFKFWKETFNGKKLDEIKKIAKDLFSRPKKHFLDIQKKWLNKSKKEYIIMIKREKERFSKIQENYTYLNNALKLINNDFFKTIPDLD